MKILFEKFLLTSKNRINSYLNPSVSSTEQKKEEEKVQSPIDFHKSSLSSTVALANFTAVNAIQTKAEKREALLNDIIKSLKCTEEYKRSVRCYSISELEDSVHKTAENIVKYINNNTDINKFSNTVLRAINKNVLSHQDEKFIDKIASFLKTDKGLDAFNYWMDITNGDDNFVYTIMCCEFTPSQLELLKSRVGDKEKMSNWDMKEKISISDKEWEKIKK